jgi:hypothetical protein
MLNKLKRHSIKKHIEKNLSERDFSKRNGPLKHLGFVVDEAFFDNFEMFYEFGVGLGLQRKDVKVFTFVETRRKIPSLRQNQISNREFNWRGEIQNQNAQEFLDYPFDVLIAFYPGTHKFLDALVAQSKAKFKMGFNDADARLFDFLLKVDLRDADAFRNEIKKYLGILKKID